LTNEEKVVLLVSLGNLIFVSFFSVFDYLNVFGFKNETMKVEIASIWKFCVACPSLAFFACLILSLWTDWQRSVFTECIKDGKKHHPYNLLPSISMMISGKK